MTAPPERYQEWLDFIFGRVTDESDPFAMDWDFDVPRGELAQLIIHTFESCGRDLATFTDKQVAIGLGVILSGTYGSFAHDLTGGATSDAQKLALMHSIGKLYRDCLAKRTPPVLGHQSRSSGNPLEFITYMLWDVSPLSIFGEYRRNSPIRTVFLETLEATLNSENRACVESALHGLGHARQNGLGAAPLNADLEAVIDRYLATDPEPALRNYAIAARTGRIQ